MKNILTIICCVIMSACTLAPGSHIALPVSTGQFQEGSITVNIHPITLESIQTIANDSHNVIELDGLQNIKTNVITPYIIGIGDVITVVVWEHPELTSPLGQFRASDEQGNVVYEDGTIFYPYAGNVYVAGKTASEVRTILRSRLQAYIEEPQIDVRVAGFKSQKYVVSGDVAQPGVFPINNIPQRLLDALNLSGGMTINANINAVTLTRNNVQYVLPVHDILYNGATAYNILLKDGDVIHVPENTARKVFVMGEVVRPQSVQLDNTRISLTQALSQAGGINELRADANGVYVIRQHHENEQEIDVYQISLKQAYQFALGDQFTLQARDIVYVSASPITRWNRFISNILPSITSIRTLDDIGGSN
jgi:polysaccharide export outer membrane protein